VRVQNVERVSAEGELEVRPDSDRDAQAALPRDGHGWAEGNDSGERLALGAQAPERAPALGKIDRAVGRCECDDFVAAAAKLVRRGPHVLVHRVGLRPRERRDHADP
jgi:hypothetical protein